MPQVVSIGSAVAGGNKSLEIVCHHRPAATGWGRADPSKANTAVELEGGLSPTDRFDLLRPAGAGSSRIARVTGLGKDRGKRGHRRKYHMTASTGPSMYKEQCGAHFFAPKRSVCFNAAELPAESRAAAQ